jgi:hypothetical protein
MKLTTINTIVAGIMAAGALSPGARAESDALLQKLVQKGILTTKEAEDLGKESKEEARHSWVVGAGMPEWVKSMRLYGDFRGRFEQTGAENPAYVERDRYRYRLRLGTVINLEDKFEIGVRFASGNPITSSLNGSLVGGSPVTANQDLNSLESRKFLWIDAAYARWFAIKNDTFSLTTTIGKMDNPFQVSNMVYDYDIDPEGAALQTSYKINDQHTIKGIGAFFVLDEFNGNTTVGTAPATTTVHATHDPYMYGGQFILESKWTKQFDTALGVSAFLIDDRNALSSKIQPFYNAGNSRDANGFLKYNYNPIVGSGSATYKFASAPLYPGEFPIKLTGEIMDNPAAPSDRNQGWRAGVTFGKAGKKGQWELNYRYQRLEADAWFDQLVDDDNGAFYAAGNPQGSGWRGGTNVKGHQVIGTYAFTDYLNFSFIYYNNELIINAPGQTSAAHHFMADLNWKF